MTNPLENTSEAGSFENKQEQLLSPGQLLFKERIARNLSIDSVAQQLLLSKQVINDIENDVTSDIYSQVAWVYVKGYLKSYAKLFDISEQQIFEALDNFKYGKKVSEKAGEAIDSFIPDDFKSATKKNFNLAMTNKFSRRAIGITVIAVVVIICIFLISLTYDRTISNVKDTNSTQNVEKSAGQPVSSSLLNEPIETNDLFNTRVEISDQAETNSEN